MSIVKQTELNKTTRILFLTSDPSDASRLRLGQEIRDIREKIQLSKFKDYFVLETRESVRPRDISQAIFDVDPDILHFSGHGEKSGFLAFEDLNGRVKPINSEALSNLFKLTAKKINCVILNACHSEQQAQLISQYINYVIGMNSSIKDSASIAFSTGFYKALAANKSISESYDFGCAEIALEGFADADKPVLYQKDKIKKTIWKLKLKADLNNVDNDKLDEIISLLNEISDDHSIKLTKIQKGSIILSFESSDEDFRKIKDLIKEGKLKEIHQIPIQEILEIKKNEPNNNFESDVFTKSISKSLPSEVMAYINKTSSIQVARITNISNWYFERVIFPGQRLIFEAPQEAMLEIHTGMMASAIISDVIPCSQLIIENPNPDQIKADTNLVDVDKSTHIPSSLIKDLAISEIEWTEQSGWSRLRSS